MALAHPGGGAVGRAVVEDQHLPRHAGIGLGGERRQTGGQVLAAVPAQDRHRHPGRPAAAHRPSFPGTPARRRRLPPLSPPPAAQSEAGPVGGGHGGRAEGEALLGRVGPGIAAEADQRRQHPLPGEEGHQLAGAGAAIGGGQRLAVGGGGAGPAMRTSLRFSGRGRAAAPAGSQRRVQRRRQRRRVPRRHHPAGAVLGEQAGDGAPFGRHHRRARRQGVEEAGAQGEAGLQAGAVRRHQQVDVAQQVVAAVGGHPVEHLDPAPPPPQPPAALLDLGEQALRRRVGVGVADQQQRPVRASLGSASRSRAASRVKGSYQS